MQTLFPPPPPGPLSGPLPGAADRSAEPASGATGASFGQALGRALETVNHAKLASDQAVQDLATGRSKDIHTTMITMEKASLSFKLMMQVRNKLVAAYQEVSRMNL